MENGERLYSKKNTNNGNMIEINQAFLALFINSILAIKEKNLNEMGHIVIKTEYFEEKKEVKILFMDNGIEISDDKIPIILEPFYSDWNEGSHIGMGLTMVNEIITSKHGGELIINNENGKQVILSIPVKSKQEKEG